MLGRYAAVFLRRRAVSYGFIKATCGSSHDDGRRGSLARLFSERTVFAAPTRLRLALSIRALTSAASRERHRRKRIEKPWKSIETRDAMLLRPLASRPSEFTRGKDRNCKDGSKDRCSRIPTRINLFTGFWTRSRAASRVT